MQNKDVRTYFLLTILCISVIFNEYFNMEVVNFVENYAANLIAYIVAVIFLVVPFLILEFSVYKKYNCELPKIYKNIEHRWEYFGWVKIITGVVIGSYLLSNASMLILKMVSYLNKTGLDYNFKTNGEVLESTYIYEFKDIYLGQGFNFILYLFMFFLWILIMFALKKYSDKIFINLGYILIFAFALLFLVYLYLKYVMYSVEFNLSLQILRNIKLLLSADGVYIWQVNIRSAFVSVVVVFNLFYFVDRNDIKKENLIKYVAFIAILLIAFKTYGTALFIDAIKFLIYKEYNYYNLERGQIFILIINLLFTNKFISDFLIASTITAIVISKYLIALKLFKTFIMALMEKYNKMEVDLINTLVKFGLLVQWIFASIFGYYVILPVVAKYLYSYMVIMNVLIQIVYIGKFFYAENKFDSIVSSSRLSKVISFINRYLIPVVLITLLFNMSIFDFIAFRKIRYEIVYAEVLIGMITIAVVSLVSFLLYSSTWTKKYKV